MKLKRLFLLLLCIAIIFIDCASIRRRKQAEQFRKYLNSQINIMTYDQALINWGEPFSLTEGDKIFIATWGAENVGGALMPIGKMLVAVPIRHGWKLQLSFDKSTRRMVAWKSDNW